ncbi:ABC transporter permease [Anaerosporobacter sp.]
MMTIHRMAIQNLSHQRFKYGILLILVVITSIGIFAGGLLVHNMKDGLEITKERIGAEVIVVPDGYVGVVEEALFKGKPCTVNFDDSWESKLSHIDGVKRSSTQAYLATLSADCCDNAIQLIAFDIQSDFSVGPWMRKNGIHKLDKNEIILGKNIGNKVGDKVKYFDREFTVVDVLEETGMGYDYCAFISFEAANEIASNDLYKNIISFKEGAASMVLLDIEDNADAMEVKEEIQNKYGEEGVSAYAVSSLIKDYAVQMEQFQVFAVIMDVFLILLAVVSIFAIITLTSYLRRNEIGSMLSVGISRTEILRVFLLEYVIVFAAGIIVAVFLVGLFAFPLHTQIRLMLNVPYRQIDILDFIKLVVETAGINAIVFLVASAYSFFKIRKADPVELIKEVNR